MSGEGQETKGTQEIKCPYCPGYSYGAHRGTIRTFLSLRPALPSIVMLVE